MKDIFRAIFCCPNKPSILPAVTSYFAKNGGVIISAECLVDESSDLFFFRGEVEKSAMTTGVEDFKRGFTKFAERYGMQWIVRNPAVKRKIMVLVDSESMLTHFMARWDSGFCDGDIVRIVTHNKHVLSVASNNGIQGALINPDEEAYGLLAGKACDSVDFLANIDWLYSDYSALSGFFPENSITISFDHPVWSSTDSLSDILESGVKQISFSSYYVGSGIEHGPVIWQDSARVPPATSCEKEKCADHLSNKMVDCLCDALRLLLDDSVIIYENRTFILGGGYVR